MHSQRAKSLILPWSLFSLRMQAWPCFPRQQLLKGWTLLSLSSIDKLLHLLPYLHLLSSLKGCFRITWYYFASFRAIFILYASLLIIFPLNYLQPKCLTFIILLSVQDFLGFIIWVCNNNSLQFDFLSHFAYFSYFTSVSCMDKFQAHSKLESLLCGNQLHYSHICCCHHQHNSCHHLCPGWFVKVKQN